VMQFLDFKLLIMQLNCVSSLTTLAHVGQWMRSKLVPQF